jgi:hypothetical protein
MLRGSKFVNKIGDTCEQQPCSLSLGTGLCMCGAKCGIERREGARSVVLTDRERIVQSCEHGVSRAAAAMGGPRVDKKTLAQK